MGPNAILRKLAGKGIASEDAFEAVQDLLDPEAQKEQIAHLLSTRYRRHDLSDFASREKVTASLVRKGFDAFIIKEVLRKANL